MEAKLSNLSVDDIAPVRKLYEDGLYLQAYRAASQLGPLAGWSGGAARVIGGRLARHLGAPRMSQWHCLLAWREEPDLPEVKYYYVLTILERRGPYAAWRTLKKIGDVPEASPKLRSDWYALHAQLAAVLRDFDTAEAWLARAEAVAPENAWVSVARSGVLLGEDRYQESLDAARYALSLGPWYRPAVQAAAHAQIQLGRDEEALAILTEAEEYIECAAITHQRIGLLVELQRYQEAKDQLERLTELMPLMETEVAQAIAGVRSDIAYFLDDTDAAIKYGRQNDGPFFNKVAEHLEEPARQGAPRVVLPVEFVRQHYQTCVPATLTAISRFWSQPAKHLEVADQICYDGTTAYSERQWAGQNGWLAREFTVTEESTAALIDRGVPFTLTIISPGNAHMQAVMGYDGRRATMLVRDPYIRYTGEFLIERFLQANAASGPRGMALVPMGMREKLDDLELPDQELWDQLHLFDGALQRHRWPEAQQIYQDMVARAPGHRLTLAAKLRLAIYDANRVALLAAVKSLLKRYPDDEPLSLSRLSCLSDLGRRDELLAAYKEICARKDAHPIFTQQYAQELAAETHEHERAIRLLDRAIRRWPTEAGSYFILANILWQQHKYEDALELYRFAICLKDKEENFARAYFNASLFIEQAEEALEFLEGRWQRLKGRSSMTARTLAWAYGQLGRWQEAIDVLDETLAEHPEDGELMLEAADLLARASRDYYARADELLSAAKRKAPRRQWYRSAARLSAVRGRPAQSLDLWQKLLKIQPLAIDAHQAAVHLLTTTQNQGAALAHLQSYTAQFPHYYPLQELLVEWYRELRLNEAYLAASRKLVELAPQNDRSLGYLGEALLWNNRGQEAYEVFRAAVELNPANSFASEMLFNRQLQDGNLAAAAETLKLFEQHSDAAFTTVKSIQLALRRGDRDQIKSRLEKLCVTPDDRGWALQTALNEIANAGMVKVVSETLDEAIRWPDAIPEVGKYWMRGCILFKKQGCVSQLQELTAAGAVGERATETYLLYLLEEEWRSRLNQFVERNRGWLVENARACSYVAFVLQQMGDKEAAMTWARDLRHLQGLQPWMLMVQVELLWDAGRKDEAAKVSEQALLLPADHATAIHRIWLAAAAAFSGDAERALGHLGFVIPTKLDPHSHILYQLTRAIVWSSMAGVSERQQVFRDVREQVQNAIQEINSLTHAKDTHRRFCRQAVRHIRDEMGSIQSWIWCYWKLYQLR